MVLAGAGYAPITARDGREALARMRASLPRLVLLDLMMPGMNGWEFRAAQRSDPALAHVPVVVMTGDGNASGKATALHASGCLQKPIDVSRLLRTVAEHTAGGRSPGVAGP
ncbi:MAG: response regulator [Sandaracinaceae bacterium]|nr:response regulator [Sandaracinaceae bacterium]